MLFRTEKGQDLITAFEIPMSGVRAIKEIVWERKNLTKVELLGFFFLS
jgi:hypothetical protein